MPMTHLELFWKPALFSPALKCSLLLLVSFITTAWHPETLRRGHKAVVIYHLARKSENHSMEFLSTEMTWGIISNVKSKLQVVYF